MDVASFRARPKVISNALLGMLIFIVAELMFFAGLMSAFTITVANQLPGNWPPPGQPRLPVDETAVNTAFLILSGIALVISNRLRTRSRAIALIVAWVLGAAFVGLQGREWVALLSQGLTLTSSSMGSFFYVIVGTHAAHAVCALLAMAIGVYAYLRGHLSNGYYVGMQAFWYFVVLLWPVIYFRVYFS